MTHWTRHASRLDRDLGRQRQGDPGYAREELVADPGAAFLCADLGLELEPREDHAAYIASWLQVLKNDTRFIVTAASHAQKALGHLKALQAVLGRGSSQDSNGGMTGSGASRWSMVGSAPMTRPWKWASSNGWAMKS